MKHFLTTVLLMLCAMAQAQSTYDLMQPFGFATVSSRTENVPYNLTLTGGGTYTYSVPEALSASTISLQALPTWILMLLLAKADGEHLSQRTASLKTISDYR